MYLGFIVFLVLNIADAITTYFGIKLGLSEGNFLLANLFKFNLEFGLIIKLIMAAILGFIILKWNYKLFLPLNISFAIIVLFNIIWIILQSNL